MLTRRQFLLSGLAAASATVLASCSNAGDKASPLAGASIGPERARLAALLERTFQAQLQGSPETMTDLGLDTGAGHWARSRLDDRSEAARERFVRRHKDALHDLKTIDRSRLSGIEAIGYDTVQYQYALLVLSAGRFAYGVKDTSRPYVLSQLNGAYSEIPDFLDSKHQIESRADAEAYLARLAAFATSLDQETGQAQRDAARGVMPPDFIIDRTLQQLKLLRGTSAAQTTLVASLSRRTLEKKIGGDWRALALALIEGPVHRALDRQIAVLEAWRPDAVSEAGVRRLPEGEAYYAFGTRLHTTTSMRPEEIHRAGLEQVADISGRMDTLLRVQGLRAGTVGERLAALGKDPRFLYPDTEAGKVQLLHDVNDRMRIVQAKLPAYFGVLPQAELEVKRVPAAIEPGAPRGYYQPGPLDGSRPGAHYLNLRDTTEWAKWYLPTFAYHEGIPGHHLQVTLALEAAGVPTLLKTGFFPGYSEGWALYAEQLADEMGAYADDPFGRIGYLQSFLFRAVRLVVDSGIHAHGWSRQRAIHYIMAIITGDAESRATSEVERYCAWPGQACSYKIGHTRWVALRERAQQQLGGNFDLRQFHDASLRHGAMPLEVLEHVIDDWLAKAT